jgi:hypothetical protein
MEKFPILTTITETSEWDNPIKEILEIERVIKAKDL